MRQIPVKYKDETLHILVDDEDYAVVSAISWSVVKSRSGMAYARNETVGQIHRFLLGLGKSKMVVDHINGNPLDNRRSNLRVVTTAQNGQNRHNISGASKYRGIYIHTGTLQKTGKTKWVAENKLDGRAYYLGLYDDELEAAKVSAAWRAAYMPFTSEADREFAQGVPTPPFQPDYGAKSSCRKGKRYRDYTGRKGVSWDKTNRRWRVRICHDGVKHHIGYFSSEEDALAARDEWVAQNGSLMPN